MSWLLRLYPRAWRRRYGEEFAALLEQQRLTPRLVLDVLRGALDAHLHPHVAPGQPTELAAIGRIVMAETRSLLLHHATLLAGLSTLLLGLALLAWLVVLSGNWAPDNVFYLALLSLVARSPLTVLGVPILAGLLKLLILGGPAAALAISAAPLLDVGLRLEGQSVVASVRMQVRWLNLALAALSAAAIGVLLLYTFVAHLPCTSLDTPCLARVVAQLMD